MKFLFRTIYYLFVAGIMSIALLLVISLAPISGNYKIKVVKSGSMEPYIKTGGIVVIKPSSSYKVGDVITFGQDTKTQIPTTHRIIEAEGEGATRQFITKGDANDSEDPVPTRESDVSGKVIFTAPYMGYILDFAKRPLGFALLVGIPALLIIFDEIMKIVSEVKRIRRKKLINETEQQNNQIN